MALHSLQHGLPWLHNGLAAAAAGCAAVLPSVLDRLGSNSSRGGSSGGGAALSSLCWAQERHQQSEQQQQQQQQQQRGFRSAPSFEQINGGATLEERRQQHVQQHTVTAAEALQALDPGPHRILIGSGCAEPDLLVDALMARGRQLSGSELVHLLTLGPAPYVQPPHSDHFHHTALFIGPNVRTAVADGRAGYLPVFLHEIPRLLRYSEAGVDVALIQVSPPDAHGFVSLGVSVDVVLAACLSARTILAEVNPHMPRTHGNAFVPVEAIDYFVRNDRPLPELTNGPIDEVSAAIGRNVAALIPNGACLQVGIGKIPDAVCASLRQHEDLGAHTEVLTDGVAELAQRGVVNCSAKTFMHGKVVATLALGTRRLYDWMDDNPMLSMHPTDFTNDPQTIARNDRMAAVNAALAVDLTGQVAADTLPGRGTFYSGIGGQVDFIRGAARSRGGVPVIALPSTAAGGAASRIMPDLGQGGAVVTSRWAGLG
jgi:acyl-CoA hydrolase